ncbi:MarR family winged helix-turn-helix transcriptional regulator [Streptomyces sp. NPDC001068]|uniref:MarR family winged helix-turn-helix transcriptional regulator n=1 Tax=Streptomyces sp. NPDC001068 TaxID=3364544 RepID=UPI0036BDC69C
MTGLSGSRDDRSGGPRDGPVPLASALADAVDCLAHLWSDAAQGASLRLSPHQLRGLRILGEEPGLNLTALAVGMKIGLPTASRLCDRLEAAGLLERVLHPHKRREVRLSLTGQGRRILDEVASRRAHALAVVLEAMEPTEREAIAEGLQGFLTAHGRTSEGRRDSGPGP